MPVLLCQNELFLLHICKQRAALQITASDISAATVQARKIQQRARRGFGMGLSGLGLFVGLCFGFFPLQYLSNRLWCFCAREGI